MMNKEETANLCKHLCELFNIPSYGIQAISISMRIGEPTIVKVEMMPELKQQELNRHERTPKDKSIRELMQQ